MKKLLLVLLSTILLTSCAMRTVGISNLSEKDSIYDLDGEAARQKGGNVEEEWHRLHAADYNEATEELGYFFGYITSIEPEDDRCTVTVENYGDNIKSGAYRFPVYDSTPIVKYQASHLKPSDLYVGMMVVILYYDYSPGDAGKEINDVIAYTVKVMNNEKVSVLPTDMDFIMGSADLDVDDPVEANAGADIIPTSAKSEKLSEKDIAKLSPAEFKKWYDGRLSKYLEKNKHVRFYYGYVTYYEEYKGKTFIDIANRNETPIFNEPFEIRIFDSTVVAKEGKALKPSDLKVGQKVIIAYYVWDTAESGSSQAVYHVEILDTKDTPDPLPDGVSDWFHS